MNSKPTVSRPVQAIVILMAMLVCGILYGWFHLAAMWLSDTFTNWIWGS